MKYKILRKSETGQSLTKAMEEYYTASDRKNQLLETIAEEQGVKIISHYGSTFYMGKIASVVFEDESKIDTKLWRKDSETEGWVPNIRSKAGKELRARIDSLSQYEIYKLGDAIRYSENFNRVGISSVHPDYFLISMNDNWNYNPPEDVIPIKESEYYTLKEAYEIK